MRKISQAKANACAWFWPMKPFAAKFSGKCWRLQRATPAAKNARSDRGPQGPPGNPQLRLFSFGQIAEEATPVAHSARSDRGLRIETEEPMRLFQLWTDRREVASKRGEGGQSKATSPHDNRRPHALSTAGWGRAGGCPQSRRPRASQDAP